VVKNVNKYEKTNEWKKKKIKPNNNQRKQTQKTKDEQPRAHSKLSIVFNGFRVTHL
jgi:hypothetical protein